jgi:CRP/FNR family transcriptional regulator, anaerobic regulatory protein
MLKELTEGIKLFIQNAKIKTFESGEIIAEIGEISDKMFYIHSGFVRGFTEFKKNEKKTAWFKYENTFFTSLTSYLKETPSIIGLEAIEKTIVFYFEKNFMEKMIEKYIEVALMYRKYIDDYFVIVEDHMLKLQSHNAQEHYDYLLSHHNQIIRRAPMGHVASFIGINQASLSRLRAKR